MQIDSVGIDLDKTTFHLVALGAAGKVLVKRKFTQKQLLAYMANLQTSLIGLEARRQVCANVFGLWVDIDLLARMSCARVGPFKSLGQ